jgi:hypothetical protein
VVVSIVEVADALRSMEDRDKHHHNNDDNNDNEDSRDKVIGDKVVNDSNDIGGDGDNSSVDVDVVVDVNGASKARSPEEEHIRAVARTLWRRRVGVLIRTAARASTTDI